MSNAQIALMPGSRELGLWIEEHQERRIKLKLAHLDGDALLAELAMHHAIIMATDDPRQVAQAASAAKGMIEFIVLIGYELGVKHGREKLELDDMKLPPSIAAELKAAAAEMAKRRAEMDRQVKQAESDRNKDVA